MKTVSRQISKRIGLKKYRETAVSTMEEDAMTGLILACLYTLYVAAAVQRKRRRLLLEDFRRTLMLFKVKTVMEHYDFPPGVPCRELIRVFDFNEAYDRIGRRR